MTKTNYKLPTEMKVGSISLQKTVLVTINAMEINNCEIINTFNYNNI